MEIVRDMMKASATFLTLLLITGAAAAQETTRPDYSKEAVQRFAMSIDIEEPEEEPFDSPSVGFRALGTTWNFNYLPGPRMRLSGTELGVGVTQLFPDPFALTNTVIATSPRAIARYRRDVSRELKRINKRLNATVDVRTE
jgi:hypothetical protein